MFRGQPKTKPATAIDQMAPGALAQTGPSAIDEIFADIARHPDRAARKTLAYLQQQQPPEAFMEAARHELVRKGKRDEPGSSLPDHTTLSRRNATVEVKGQIDRTPQGLVYVIVDRTGLNWTSTRISLL